eukprot:scaffold125056_cov30-Tisochrysis_lutea.AAC.2
MLCMPHPVAAHKEDLVHGARTLDTKLLEGDFHLEPSRSKMRSLCIRPSVLRRAERKIKRVVQACAIQTNRDAKVCHARSLEDGCTRALLGRDLQSARDDGFLRPQDEHLPARVVEGADRSAAGDKLASSEPASVAGLAHVDVRAVTGEFPAIVERIVEDDEEGEDGRARRCDRRRRRRHDGAPPAGGELRLARYKKDYSTYFT